MFGLNRRWLGAVILLCSSSAASPAIAQTTCPVPLKNLLVQRTMSDLYLWSEEIPDLDPTRFPSPEAYLEAIRYQPLDSHYSYIEDRQTAEAFFGEGSFVGFGFSSRLESSDIRISQVFPGSPADDAGLARGDRITAVDDVPVATLVADGAMGSVFGTSTIGLVRRLRVTGDAGVREITLTKRVVTIPTVSYTRVFEQQEGRVGYLFFRTFVGPSREALDTAFAALQAAGATELVLDLRYNGGGLVEIAQHLASLIGGVLTEGRILGTYRHNPRNAFRDTDIRMAGVPNSLGVRHLVVIATSSTASASELIVNGLKPYLPVTVVGARTYGKPVGQYAVPFCDKVLAAVSFAIRNVNGDGDYYDGLPADCPAPDDLDHPLGDPSEASLRVSLAFLATGTCGDADAPQRLRQSPPLHRPTTGLDAVILAN